MSPVSSYYNMAQHYAGRNPKAVRLHNRAVGTIELRRITREHLEESAPPSPGSAPASRYAFNRAANRWEPKRGVGNPHNYMAQQMAQQQSAYNAALNQIMMQRHSSHVHISNLTPGTVEPYYPPMSTEDKLGLLVCITAVGLLLAFMGWEIWKLFT